MLDIRRHAVALAATVLAGSACVPGGAPPPGETADDIEVTYLAMPDGRPLENPRGLSEDGEVLAQVRDEEGSAVAAVWENGEVTLIGDPDNPDVRASGGSTISREGKVVGASSHGPYEWSRKDGWRLIPVKEPFTPLQANDEGQILGRTSGPPVEWKELLPGLWLPTWTPYVAVWDWDEGRLFTPPVSARPLFRESHLFDGRGPRINNRGQVLLDATIDGSAQAAIWDVVGGEVTGLGFGRPRAINDAGEALGEETLWRDGELIPVTPEDCCPRAEAFNDHGHVAGTPGYLWRDGEVTDLGSLGSTNNNGPWPNAVNNRDQVVGSAVPADTGQNRAFLWRDGEMINIGALADGALTATAINDRGQILGKGLGGNAVLWTLQPS